MAEKEEEEGAANWSDLPYDLMEQILDQLAEKTPDISYYARCAAVCVSWQHAYDIHEPYIRPQLPVLMIPSTNNTPSSSSSNELEADDGFCSFYRTADGKVLDQFEVKMPRNSHCRGSGHGWLIMVDDDLDKGFPVRLFNPFLSAHNEILLPSLKHLPVIEHQDNQDSDPPCGYTYLHKAILSADPLSHPDYIVMAIYGNKLKRLAFLRPGDEAWTPIKKFKPHIRFEDVIHEFKMDDDPDSEFFWKHMLYAVTREGCLVCFSVADLLAQKTQMGGSIIVRGGPPSINTRKLYLVSTGRMILLVLRTIDMDNMDDEAETTNRSIHRPYSTKEFKVFRFVTSGLTLAEPCTREWKEIHNLEGWTIFIGDNTSTCFNAADYPPGCKPDCIYYTDDCYLRYVKNPQNGPHDMGVFNVIEGSFEKHFPTNDNNPMWPVPVWIEPSLQKTGNIYKCRR